MKNPVAKNQRKVNRFAVMTDRKLRMKRGYMKHRKNNFDALILGVN